MANQHNEEISTFTLYAHHASLKDSALERLKQLRSALFQDSGPFDDDTAYLETVNIDDAPYFALIDNRKKRVDELHILIECSAPKSLETKKAEEEISRLETEIRNMDAIFDRYVEDHNTAITNYRHCTAELGTLVDGNHIYLAPPEKQQEYLYCLDQHTCSHLYKHPVPIAVDDNQRCFFTCDEHIDMVDEQTDAVRISANGVTLENITIEDKREYGTVAHRDAFQLIPPPKVEECVVDGKKTNVRLADQLAGTVLSDVVIRQCNISCKHGPLQGIFASDGLLSNITIDSNQIKTAGAHSITLAGLLDRSQITNNILHQVTPDIEPAVQLFPLRIGGNMAEEGVVVVLSFAKGNRYKYEKPVFKGNVVKPVKGRLRAAKLLDMRSEMPEDFLEFAVGLHDFNYDAYFLEYTRSTIGDFRKSYADEYQRMHEWLTTRIAEYGAMILGTPVEENPLPGEFDGFENEGIKNHEYHNIDASLDGHIAEKTQQILPLLIESMSRLDKEEKTPESAFWSTRLGSLQESPIRNFSMKAIAIQHGCIAQFKDLPEPGRNKIRAQNLRFLTTTV